MKIYVLGDSISMQYGPSLEAYLEGVISYSRKEGEEEALLNLDNPRGANGGDSGMVLTFLKAKCLSLCTPFSRRFLPDLSFRPISGN
jgi:hypothetical protein